ncbi:hydroxyacylglutathione hydrolase [Halobacteriovorax sp. GB3]|uniref:hydroxyacylglutathione hydrolase n=1 Tax=Halobacteriovorax sp. GB3 TaxID=2719615 RepID=UPI00235ED6CA|nr:hydroxyacylglutathione hydrolase [Halobacteriovorax sp. GB3]MDD0853758.1 hydroxyacylglutathione hydrolase [Halobacteriovorax sp. GB3]
MKVHQFYTFSPLRNFCYILEDSSDELYVIDPFDGADVFQRCEKLGKKVKAIINTHEHHDHVMGNDELQRLCGCEVWAHEKARGRIKNVDNYLNDNQILKTKGNHCVKVLYTPGHTLGHLCLLVLSDEGKQSSLICGDTLFNAGVGNCHNGGDPSVLYETFRDHIFTLDDHVLVYPGHDYLKNNLLFTLDREPGNEMAKKKLEEVQDFPDGQFVVTTIGEEREINTFFRLSNSEIKKNLSALECSEKDIFIKLREKRNHW